MIDIACERAVSPSVHHTILIVIVIILVINQKVLTVPYKYLASASLVVGAKARQDVL